MWELDVVKHFYKIKIILSMSKDLPKINIPPAPKYTICKADSRATHHYWIPQYQHSLTHLKSNNTTRFILLNANQIESIV